MSEGFGAAVRAVLAESNLTYRQARNKTGIDHSTLWDMAHDHVPSREKVLQFARAFGRDRNEWLALAGYEEDWDPDAALVAGVRELQAEFGPFQWSTEMIPLSRATPEEIEAILADIRARVEDRMRKG